ncbi:hypothetical protein ACH40E_03570 [Streptomyces acidicola]|uniref:hypothetical protein n=1 Tax=Streptomyces acidicola TaxID=2596892 RepID=UPI0037923225
MHSINPPPEPPTRGGDQVVRTAPKFGLNGFLITCAPKAAACRTIRQIAAQADREGNDGFAHSQAEFVTAHA